MNKAIELSCILLFCHLFLLIEATLLLFPFKVKSLFNFPESELINFCALFAYENQIQYGENGDIDT